MRNFFEICQEASHNNSAKIQEWLTANLSNINQAWDGKLPQSAMVRASGAAGGSGALYTIVEFALGGMYLTPGWNLICFFASVIFVGISGATWALNRSYEEKHRGWTLLQFAAEAGATKVAELLINNKANERGNLVNGYDKDFIDIAKENGHTEFAITFLIKRYEAKIAALPAALEKGKVDLLKREITGLEGVIEKHERFKDKAEGDILALVKKYQKLRDEYKKQFGISPPETPREKSPETPRIGGMGMYSY
jgi:hypothetical protein